MKNTKIMAVLVVLLAAMLFVGAASAAYEVGTSLNSTDTDKDGNVYYHTGESILVNITYSGTDYANMSKINQSIVAWYNGVSYKFDAWNVVDGKNVTTATIPVVYGVDQTITFAKNTTYIYHSEKQ